ncbi:MAG: hypothetical protein K0S08_1228 [Gammaproteobacteria bacterium]|nr:hypothetical protein [Gammaproteobacteria bacterium]
MNQLITELSKTIAIFVGEIRLFTEVESVKKAILLPLCQAIKKQIDDVDNLKPAIDTPDNPQVLKLVPLSEPDFAAFDILSALNPCLSFYYSQIPEAHSKNPLFFQALCGYFPASAISRENNLFLYVAAEVNKLNLSLENALLHFKILSSPEALVTTSDLELNTEIVKRVTNPENFRFPEFVHLYQLLKPELQSFLKPFYRELTTPEKQWLFWLYLLGCFPRINYHGSEIEITPDNLHYCLAASLANEYGFNIEQRIACFCLMRVACANPMHLLSLSHGLTSKDYLDELLVYAARLLPGSRMLYVNKMLEHIVSDFYPTVAQSLWKKFGWVDVKLNVYPGEGVLVNILPVFDYNNMAKTQDEKILIIIYSQLLTVLSTMLQTHTFLGYLTPLERTELDMHIATQAALKQEVALKVNHHKQAPESSLGSYYEVEPHREIGIISLIGNASIPGMLTRLINALRQLIPMLVAYAGHGFSAGEQRINQAAAEAKRAFIELAGSPKKFHAGDSSLNKAPGGSPLIRGIFASEAKLAVGAKTKTHVSIDTDELFGSKLLEPIASILPLAEQVEQKLIAEQARCATPVL